MLDLSAAQAAPGLFLRALGQRSIRGLTWRGLDHTPVATGVLAAFLSSRGWAQEAIDVDLDTALFVASCQPGFQRAANLIADAIETDAGVFVFGDYDVDGITSTAIWRTVCAAYGVRAHSKIPTRGEGYGFSCTAAGMPRALRCALLICVDSGTDRVTEIDLAKSDGVVTVVVDHHLPKSADDGAGVSSPHALLNGHFSAEPSMRHLCAAGQSYALALHVLRLLRGRGRPCPEERAVSAKLLQLATIGTVSDMMELVGYNRAVVRAGLAAINADPAPAVKTLLEAAGARHEVKADTLGYGVGPMINAAGRYSKPDVALKLLLCDDPLALSGQIVELQALNERRRNEQKTMLDEAMERIDLGRPIAFYAGYGWEKGLVGLVAGGVMQTLNRPSLVGAVSGDLISGSGRSTDGFDLGHAVIAAHQAGLIVQGGGHAKACGFTCHVDQIPGFLKFLEARFLEEQRPVEHAVDLVLHRDGVRVDEFAALASLAPYGQGWREPRVAVDVRIRDAHIIGERKDTLRLGCGFKAIAFRVGHNGLADLVNATGREAILIASPKVAEWQGAKQPEMIVEDVILV